MYNVGQNKENIKRQEPSEMSKLGQHIIQIVVATETRDVVSSPAE